MKKSLWLGVSFALILSHAQVSLADLDVPMTEVVRETSSKNKNGYDEQASMNKAKRDYQFFPAAVLLSGTDNSVGAPMGPYRVVTDLKSLALKNRPKAKIENATKADIVVREPKTGKFGLADGELLIKPKFASDREVILQQYSLTQMYVAPNGSFFTARVSNINDLPSVFNAIVANPFVLEADISVNYFDQVPN